MVNFNDGFGGANILEVCAEASARVHEVTRTTSFSIHVERAVITVHSIAGVVMHCCFRVGLSEPDRIPYATLVGSNGTHPTTLTAYSRLAHNFIVANYAADGGCFDNDDG